MSAIEAAVTWLFVPGDRPERFDKAAAAGADAVILDLQDAVAPDAKAAARANVTDWLGRGNRAAVRINPPGTTDGDADVAALAGTGDALAAVMVPLAEDPAACSSVAEATGAPVVALVETARGIENLAAVAAAPGVARVAFGHLDLAADLGCDPSWDSMLAARGRIVLASRAAGLPQPIDGVTANVKDEHALRDDTARARGLGFGGKLCIHPAQVAPVGDLFAPSEPEISWAQRVIDAAADSPSGVVTVDGAMVDSPVVARAAGILARARARE